MDGALIQDHQCRGLLDFFDDILELPFLLRVRSRQLAGQFGDGNNQNSSFWSG